MDSWPTASYCYDRQLSGYVYGWPAIGICFDVGKIGPGKYGMTCWEILWKTVEPQQIAGSLLSEGHILESENVYCLGIQNKDARRLEQLFKALEKNAGFLEVCASPNFLAGENVMREPLVRAGEVDGEGKITGISYNARLALSQVRRDKKAVLTSDKRPIEIRTGPSLSTDPAVKLAPLVTAQAYLQKWWHLRKR